MADTMVKIACWLYGLRHRKTFRAARALEGNAAHMDRDERYWWGYKYYFGPIERAEPDSGIEAFFHDQDLDFRPRDDFVESTSLELCAGGDVMAYAGLAPETTGALWDDVRDFYLTGDIVYANLESPIMSSAPPCYIPKSIMKPGLLNNSPQMLDRIIDDGRGINLLSTANNHCLDMGEAGLRETLDLLDSKGCLHVGTSRSPEERDRVVMVERQGIRIAFVSCTFGINTSVVPEGKEYLVNYVRLNKPDTDIAPIALQVAAAKAAGAEVVVALLHWSLEFETYPARNILEMGHRVLELGIDVIIGNHPHNVQPVERYAYVDARNGRKREGLILYALGDLLSIHRTLPDSRLACLARIHIARGVAGGETCVRVTGLAMLPVYLLVRTERGRCVDYRVLDFQKLVKELESGQNRFRLGFRARKELSRLEALMRRVLHAVLRVSSARSSGTAA